MGSSRLRRPGFGLVLAAGLVLVLGGATAAAGPTLAWTRQFGSSGWDSVTGVAVRGTGRIIVAGGTAGSLPGQASKGSFDAYVRTYKPSGTVVWTRQFGTSAYDYAEGVAVDPSGNVVVVGFTDGALPGKTFLGVTDAFVRKYRANGSVAWTRQFGTSLTDHAAGVATDRAGNIYVVGYTEGALPGKTSRGDDDVFVRKYRPDGRVSWTRQFGTSANDDARAVATDPSGNVLVAGRTGGALPRQTNRGAVDAFVRKYRPNGRVTWTRQFGTAATDDANAVTTDGSGRVYVTGAMFGGMDAFVRQLKPSGRTKWTKRLGAAGTIDRAWGVGRDRNGNVFLGGDTDGALPGQSSRGDWDGFVAKYRR